jgi:hypothetical protein
MNETERDLILKELRDDIKEVKESQIEVNTVLKGYNGKLGLCEQVEKNTKGIVRLTIACIVIASAAGGGTFAAIKALVGV